MTKTYKYRLYPNKEQCTLIDKTIGCSRFVYNYYLNERIIKYKNEQINLSCFDCINDLSKLKKSNDFIWLKEVDSTALQQSLKDLDLAYSNFFKKNSGYPKFKSKKHSKLSYRTTNTGNIKIENSHISLRKLGKVKLKIDRYLTGKILNATITHTRSDKYFISVCVSEDIIQFKENTNKNIGLDLGLKDFIITSDGEKFENLRYLKQSQNKLAKLQRRLSRKTIGSNNWDKARIKVARLQEKIANQRNDYLHKLSTYFINNYDIICLEDLSVNNMIKNHKLAKSISDVSWATFVSYLSYKANWYNKTIVKVDKFYPSTKTCNVCGYKNNNLTLSDRHWTCLNCNSTLDRDINAAKNILDEGLKLIA